MIKRLLVGVLCMVIAIAGVGCAQASSIESEKKGDETVGNLTMLGRASVKIELENGKVIYIDPFAGSAEDYSEPADLVLVTHQHGDHNNVDLVTLNEGGQVIQCPTDVTAGDTLEAQGIEIMAVPAYNDNHAKEVCCGFVLKMDGLTFYHSGDTSKIEEMAELTDLNIDYALICMDDFYNMGPEEAMEVAEIIKPRVVVPIHTSPQGEFDQATVTRFNFEETVVLEPQMNVSLVKVN